eukprot:46074_1
MDNLFSHHLTMGFRRDGRRPYEVRKVECKLSVVSNANGSALFNIGNTSVIASVYGPQHPKNRESRQNRDESTIIVRCTTSSFSSTSHRDVSRNHRTDRLLSNTIKSTFDAIVMKHLYPRCSIEIVLEILQNDGGEMSAAINATTLALIDAGIALNEYGVSCSAGYIDGNHVPLLDLNYYEKTGTRNYKIKAFSSHKMMAKKARHGKSGQKTNKQIKRLQALEKEQQAQMKDVDIEEAEREKENEEQQGYCSGQLTLAIMPVSNKIITMQMQSIIDIDKMEKLLQICQKGCKDIHKIMKTAVKTHSFQLMQHRGFINR